jgi:heme exporter protein CcmD
MTDLLQQFFYMNGHGMYVFSAYGGVLFLLALQWFIPWWRWRRFLRQQKLNHE